MPRNTSVSLEEHFSDFIEASVRSGRYASASDVVRAGLRLLEEEEAKLAQLRAGIVKGDASGEAREFDWDALRERTLAEHRAIAGVAQ